MSQWVERAVEEIRHGHRAIMEHYTASKIERWVANNSNPSDVRFCATIQTYVLTHAEELRLQAVREQVARNFDAAVQR